MPRFKFRLEPALSIAERTLEEKQRVLAQELEKLTLLQEHCRVQEHSWQEALVGQKEALGNALQDLGRWQQFAQYQFECLRRLEGQTEEQEHVVLEKRRDLLEAHKEVEKLSKLKEKRKTHFMLAEERREQMVIDEAGQMIFRRNQLQAKTQEMRKLNDLRDSS